MKKTLLITLLFLASPSAFAAPDVVAPATPTTSAEPIAAQVKPTHFEWEPIRKALSYELEIRSFAQGAHVAGKPELFEVTVPDWTGTLVPGSYTMRLRSKDQRGVPGEWSEPEPFKITIPSISLTMPKAGAVIQTKTLKNVEIHFKWSKGLGAVRYEFSLENDSHTIKEKKIVTTNELSLILPTRDHFRWRVVTIDQSGNLGEPLKADNEFTIWGKALDEVQIIKPANVFVRALHWTESESATKYFVVLWRKDPNTNQWVQILKREQSENDLNFEPKWLGGDYRLSITAGADFRANSKTIAIGFNVISGDRSFDAETKYKIRLGIDFTDGMYFIASYLLTQINYSASNVDTKVATSTTALGGTGRLGLGYLQPNKPYGLLGIIDLSGFTIDGRNHTYAALETHGVYRRAVTERGDIRLSAGLYYKELPEIVSNVAATAYSMENTATYGPHAGFEYWYSLGPLYGVQANARFYYPLAGHTPNGKDIIPTLSHQMGLMGSLHLSRRMTGLAGLAYRVDQVSYKSSTGNTLPGLTKNESKVQGTYLNLYLEWSI